jgi:hypothetical protein
VKTLIFRRHADFLAACEKLQTRQLPFETLSVGEPDLPENLQPVDRTVPLAALGGGCLGFTGFYLLCYFSTVEYPLIVAGQPLHSAAVFALIGFEGAILLAMLSCFYAFLASQRLPDFRLAEAWRERAWRSVRHGSFALHLPQALPGELESEIVDWGADEIF